MTKWVKIFEWNNNSSFKEVWYDATHQICYLIDINEVDYDSYVNRKSYTLEEIFKMYEDEFMKTIKNKQKEIDSLKNSLGEANKKILELDKQILELEGMKRGESYE